MSLPPLPIKPSGDLGKWDYSLQKTVRRSNRSSCQPRAPISSYDGYHCLSAVLLKEAMSPQFKAYEHQIVKNSRTLAKFLISEGFKIFSGGTDTHVMLVNLRDQGMTGDVAESILDSVGITVNKCKVPFDAPDSPKPGGIRLGPSAVTTRGMKKHEMEQVAKLVALVLKNPQDRKVLDNVRKEVKQLTKKFPLISEEWKCSQTAILPNCQTNC